jgi:primary-amine oxidase
MLTHELLRLMVEIMPPNKTDVVSYLDGHGVAPARYAHVIIDQRATLEPYYQDLLVGPLPLNNSTVKYESLTYTYTRKTEGRVRNIDADQDVLFYEWIFNQTASLLDVTLHLWNGSMLGLENETLTV